MQRYTEAVLVEKETTPTEVERSKPIEVDAQLLERLRARHPGKTDREIFEGLARVNLGFAALRWSQERNALSEKEATELGVQAVHEARAPSAQH